MSNPKEIAEFLKVEDSTISGLLDRMESKGLLTREIDLYDRRHIMIRLTEQANALQPHVIEIVEQVNQDVLTGFSEEETAVLKEFLRRIKN